MPPATVHAGQWRRPWWKARYRVIRCDARFADGDEEHDVDLNAVLQEARFPADHWCTLNGAKDACPPAGVGPWVEHPYGRPLQSRR